MEKQARQTEQDVNAAQAKRKTGSTIIDQAKMKTDVHTVKGIIEEVLHMRDLPVDKTFYAIGFTPDQITKASVRLSEIYVRELQVKPSGVYLRDETAPIIRMEFIDTIEDVSTLLSGPLQP